MEDMNILNSMVDLSKMANIQYSNRMVASVLRTLTWSVHRCQMSVTDEWHVVYDVPHSTSLCLFSGSIETFFFINKTMTWTEAQKYCRTKYTDLASVRNMTENQKIQDLKGPEERAWIGLSRDSWKWSDGSNSSFGYWRAGEPNNRQKMEACVSASFDLSGKWEDEVCHWKMEFICYSPLPTTKRAIKVRVSKKTSGQDLNEPAVMEEMLEKLRQRLKDQGVNPDTVELSWRKQADGKVFHKVEKKTEKKTKKTEL
ncbi:Hepatic lectin [Nibea albiflora]|uniref:Hepatic lectin n=1 Tax=Nibea albiflora TaxID=240163 RepID=A0ACB7EMI7_NIBAL|nr:Hepatic lectin [Nibea albiflora]